jgi:hypothetical protein
MHYFQRTKGGQKIEVPEPREQAEDRRKREEDQNTPAPGARPEPDPTNKGQYRVRTKSGAYSPWAPKSVEEGAMAGDPRATGLFNREHPGKQTEEDKGGWTPGESREIASRSRRYQTRVQALERVRAEELADPTDKSKERVQALDAEIEGLYAKLDDIDKDVMSRRKGGAPGGNKQTVHVGTTIRNAQTGERRKYDPKDPKAGKDGWVILTQAQGGK